MDGRATLTMATSRTVMKKAAQTTARAFQRRGSSSVGALILESPGSATVSSVNAGTLARIPRGSGLAYAGGRARGDAPARPRGPRGSQPVDRAGGAGRQGAPDRQPHAAGRRAGRRAP